MRAALHFTPLELDIAFEELRLARPYPLDVPQHGATTAARGQLREDCHRRWAKRGYARRGRLIDEVSDLLCLLARPAVSVEVVGLVDVDADRRLAARGAIGGRDATLAVWDEEGIRVEAIGTGDLPDRAAALVPADPPARFASVTFPVGPAAPDVGPAAPDTVLGTVYDRAPSDDGREAALRAVSAMLRYEQRWLVCFTATVAGRRGAARRDPGLQAFGTGAGAYLGYSRVGADGALWAVYRPGGRQRLAEQLHTLIARPTR